MKNKIFLISIVLIILAVAITVTSRRSGDSSLELTKNQLTNTNLAKIPVESSAPIGENNLIPVSAPSGSKELVESIKPNVIFWYGVGAKNKLNTFEGTYTKDMVMDEPVTIKFNLTSQEINNIYQKINDLKIFDKEKVVKENVYFTPCSSYYLKVQAGAEQKELSWDNCHGKISDKLQQFSSYVISIIEAKEEYKKIPTAKGGYQ